MPGGPEGGAELERGDQVLTSLVSHRQLPRHHSIAGEEVVKRRGKDEEAKRRGEDEEAKRRVRGGDEEGTKMRESEETSLNATAASLTGSIRSHPSSLLLLARLAPSSDLAAPCSQPQTHPLDLQAIQQAID